MDATAPRSLVPGPAFFWESPQLRVPHPRVVGKDGSGLENSHSRWFSFRGLGQQNSMSCQSAESINSTGRSRVMGRLLDQCKPPSCTVLLRVHESVKWALPQMWDQDSRQQFVDAVDGMVGDARQSAIPIERSDIGLTVNCG
jgi:hypothetical protein